MEAMYILHQMRSDTVNLCMTHSIMINAGELLGRGFIATKKRLLLHGATIIAASYTWEHAGSVLINLVFFTG